MVKEGQTLSAEVEMAGSRWAAVERTVYAALVGAVAVAAPPLLYWYANVGADDRWLIAWVLAPILGPLVFELLSRPRPEWGWGLAFAAALGVVFGIWGGIDPPFEYSGAGQAAIIGAFLFVLTFLAGMVGASIASLVARPLNYDAPRRRPSRLKAWHVGAIIASLDVAIVAILAAARI